MTITIALMTSLGISFVSAIVPWVNAEALVLALPAVAHSNAELGGLVAIVTLGQMAGKCVVYFAGHRGVTLGSAKTAERLARWQEKAGASPWRAIALVAFSSVVGIPPFYLMSMIAGAVRMNLVWFLAAGTCGRLIRFSAIAAAALTLSPRP